MSRSKLGVVWVPVLSVSVWVASVRVPASPAGGEGETRPVAVFPLSFVENRGQWRDEVLFAACRGGIVASFIEDGFRLHLGAAGRDPQRRSVTQRSVTLRFEGGCPGEVAGEAVAPTLFSFLRGSSPRPERSSVRSYGSLLYRHLYPGVDVRIREAAMEEPSRQIEYDLHLEPGAPLEAIVIRCEGTDAVEVDADGSILLTAGSAVVRQPPPVCWQVLPSGEPRPVECRVAMLDGCRFGFEVPGRDPALPLVIDPAIVFATYLGGAGEDFIFGMALEPTGVVVAGFTSSTEPLPAEDVGDDGYAGGRYDGFVARLDPELRELRSFTFLGGSGEERLLSLARTSVGKIVVAGSTSSRDDFPTTPDAAQTAFGGGTIDGFLTVLDPTATTIEYSTFLGGPLDDGITSVIADTLDRIIVAGYSFSPDFADWPGLPASGGGFQERNRGASDVIVLRLNVGPDVPREDQVEYCTFLGGSSSESFDDVNWEAWRDTDRSNKPDLALGNANTVFVSGVTGSWDFPTTPGCYQPSYAGNWDAFLCHLSLERESPPADQLLYSTYLGGSDADAACAIGLDPSGDVWVSGFNFSGNFPTTPDAYSRTRRANDDAFLTRLRVDAALPPAEQLVYSTLIGGSGYDYSQAHTVDDTGTITVVGCRMGNGDFPMTDPGGSEGFIAQFKPAGDDGEPPYVLRYASSVGNMWYPKAIAKTSADTYLVAGYMPGIDLPSFEGAFQPHSAGGWESGIAVMSLKVPTPCFSLDAAPEGGAPFEVRADAACSETPEGTEPAAYGWDFGDGTQEDGVTVSHDFEGAGRYVIALTVTNSVGISATISRSVTLSCAQTEVSPWAAADIGSPLFPGAFRKEGEEILLCAGGRGFIGAADDLHFLHEAHDGDFALTVLASEVSIWQAGANLGLMARDGLEPGAPFVAIVLEMLSTAIRPRLRYREVRDTSVRSRLLPVTEIPRWLRLARSGDLLVAKTSSDGAAWEEIERQEIPGMPANLLVGLVASGQDSGDETKPFTPLQARVSDLRLGPLSTEFLRGDPNSDGGFDLSDPVFTLGYLFRGELPPTCLDAADADDNGKLEITDAIYSLQSLFLGGPAPPSPFGACGLDPTEDDLGCESFAGCP